ncbi:MAG: hypothetical protein ACFCU2_07075 [Acidimicrobiia bacterium]
MSDVAPRIGTLREKPLHASLKDWYALPGDRVECPVEGFVIDLVRGDLLIEIQTSGFSSMKRKVLSLLDAGHRVRIVHPIPVDRWIVKVDNDGTILSRRRSPRHGAPTDVFSELVSFPGSMAHPGLEVEVLMTVEEQYRNHTPDRAWRRKGWTVLERRLVDVVDTSLLTDIDDLTELLPSGLPDEFTTADLAARLGRPQRTGQQIAYCLRTLGAVIVVGKVGNTVLYQLR